MNTSIKPNANVIKDLYFSRKNLFIMRLVSWDGKSPVLEKRKLYIDKDTKETKHGRVMGFNKFDLSFIRENWGEIESLINKFESNRNQMMRDGKWPIREVGKIEND